MTQFRCMLLEAFEPLLPAEHVTPWSSLMVRRTDLPNLWFLYVHTCSPSPLPLLRPLYECCLWYSKRALHIGLTVQIITVVLHSFLLNTKQIQRLLFFYFIIFLNKIISKIINIFALWCGHLSLFGICLPITASPLCANFFWFMTFFVKLQKYTAVAVATNGHVCSALHDKSLRIFHVFAKNNKNRFHTLN